MTTTRFIDRFEAVIFDLNGTLAEDFDRFGEGQDYHATYRALGGTRLSSDELVRAVEQSLERCLERYRRGPWDPFPTYRAFLSAEFHADGELVEDTVAAHELGSVPRPRLRWLREQAEGHRLGLLSDLWAPPRLAREFLEREGLAGLFGSIVLSCEHGAVKPGPRLFLTALEELGARPEDALFVGDNYPRDIEGAAACGLATVWICRNGVSVGRGAADRIVERVELLSEIG
jgi:HAD superfamily hydrolase (TIGR01509 family)